MVPGWPLCTSSVARRILAAGVAAATGLGCGGTTGREDAPPSVSDASAANDATAAATLDAGLFDVTIQYTDRELPDVGMPANLDAGDSGEGSFDWSTCPPDLPADIHGVPINDGGASVLWVPADWDDAGNVIPALIEIRAFDAFNDQGPFPLPDAGQCATHVWFGNAKVDACLRVQGGGVVFPSYPPCQPLADAGNDQHGTPRYQLCDHYLMCALANPECLLGSGQCILGPNPSLMQPVGPCATEALAALERTPAQILQALENASTCGPPYSAPGNAGGCVGAWLDQGTLCFSLFDAGSP